ncbi:MAG: hypothetical protein ABIP90_07435, partial [Vicinamibacterales bacterium]
MFLLSRRVSAAASARDRKRWLICAVFVLVFVVYALNYAYFFVDDEVIPFVYAQNVLDGYGLAYNPDDGRVEGYSDFLTVWIDVAILKVATTAGAGKLWAIAMARALAFVCGVALLIGTFMMLSRRFTDDGVPVVAGMAFLALSGPLAMWSCTALETTL